MARYTVETLSGIDVDGRPAFYPVGGLEIATTPERLEELTRRHGWLTAWGVEGRLLDVAECLKHWPRLNPHVVLGGYLVPSDGLAKAVRDMKDLMRAARR